MSKAWLTKMSHSTLKSVILKPVMIAWTLRNCSTGLFKTKSKSSGTTCKPRLTTMLPRRRSLSSKASWSIALISSTSVRQLSMHRWFGITRLAFRTQWLILSEQWATSSTTFRLRQRKRRKPRLIAKRQNLKSNLHWTLTCKSRKECATTFGIHLEMWEASTMDYV